MTNSLAEADLLVVSTYAFVKFRLLMASPVKIWLSNNLGLAYSA